MRYPGGVFISGLMLLSCGGPETSTSKVVTDTAININQVSSGNSEEINTGNTTPDELVSFAQTLKGIPYQYGSTDPKQGFDCSGFITYVFNHFNIAVPRSSVDFSNMPHEVKLKNARTGDLILFTGTDSTNRTVGHMGILIAQPGQELKFIHATSGKANGVTQTPLNPYYQGRYVKTIRVFKQNNNHE